MFQIALALEGRLGGNMITAATGSGFVLAPWYLNIAGIIYQGSPGVRRFGVVILCCFVSLQIVSMDAIHAHAMKVDPRRK